MSEKHNEQILEAIRNNDRRALQKFYNSNREFFFAWCIKNYGLTKEECGEVYQQANLILYRNVTSGKLKELTSKPITYLCSVGKNILMQQFRSKKRHIHVIDIPIEEMVAEEDPVLFENTEEEKERREQNKQLVKHLLSKIGNPCASLLEMIFVKGMHPEAVASALNYKNEGVVRKKKSYCLKHLREIVQEEANSNL
jgi:RNA polymerase sigma-70 factor (ECF subfamily)